MTGSARLFLNVETSYSGQRWLDRLDPGAAMRAQAMVQLHGMGDVVSRILAARGQGPEGVAEFLEPTVRALMPDPSTLVDMDAAVDRLASAILSEETVAIFGDYDVDGASSSALLGSFRSSIGQLR